MGKVQFQCRQHVPAPSFSGSCTVGPFLAHPLQGFPASHALYTLAFPGDSFPPTVFKPQPQVPQIWLFNQGLFPQASSLQIPLHVGHLYLEIVTSADDLPSINTYTCHIHRRPSLSSCRFILFGGTVTQLDTLLRKHPHSLFLTVSIQ